MPGTNLDRHKSNDIPDVSTEALVLILRSSDALALIHGRSQESSETDIVL